MPIIYTDEFSPAGVPQSTVRQVYNGLDCCITSEVFREVSSLGGNEPNLIYNFERALQAPVLEMMMRGFKVDQYERRKGVELLQKQIAHLDRWLQEMAVAIWDKPLNPRSPKQLIEFLFGVMRLPEQWKNDKGRRRLSTDREALEKLEIYFYAQPIISTILEIRNLGKKLSVLETEIDPDGRMRTSYNIAGTETGRWSSSGNAFGTGTNLQNVTAELRKIFIADQGYKLVGIDLEQAESREVGWQCGVLFDDWSYLDACYSGDLHTTVTRQNWLDLPWTDDPKANKAIAEQLFYRHYTYRDMSKKLGHGCLTEDHEVLTKNGWVKIGDKPEEILAWSQKEGSYFTPVERWADFTYQGDLISFEGNSISALMTEDHRVPYKKDAASPILHEKLAGTGPGTLMPLGDNYVGGEKIVPGRLIAAFMSDGHQHTTNSMKFHFHKERKKKRLKELCKIYQYSFRETDDHIYVEGSFPKRPGAFMFDWTRDSLEDFLDEYKYWDGHQAPTSVSLFSKHKEDLEWIQTFGRILGIGGAIQKPRTSGFGTEMWTLQQNNRQYATGRSIIFNRLPSQSVRVLCPTVATSWFYVRRNGKIFVTGNSNYYGQPFTMARHAKIPTRMAEEFQQRYFAAFPGIQRWHRWTAQQLQQNQLLVTPFGRKRHFFGRQNDDATLREAIAFVPQSSTGDRMNLGLYRIWKHMRDRVQLIAQVHDAVYFQYPEHLDEREIIEEALAHINVEITYKDRKLIVPGEAKSGWNWGNYDEKLNPNGLKKCKGKDGRERLTGLSRVA